MNQEQKINKMRKELQKESKLDSIFPVGENYYSIRVEGMITKTTLKIIEKVGEIQYIQPIELVGGKQGSVMGVIIE